MKISTTPIDSPVAISTANALNPKGASQAVTTARADASKSTQSAGVAVTVSTMARSLKTTGSSSATADVDMNKVNAMRNAIAQGSFKVNPEAIADKMLSNAQEMLQRSRI